MLREVKKTLYNSKNELFLGKEYNTSEGEPGAVWWRG